MHGVSLIQFLSLKTVNEPVLTSSTSPTIGKKNADVSCEQNHSRDSLLENKDVKNKHVRVPENMCQGQDMLIYVV